MQYQELLNVNELSKLIGLSKPTIYRKIKSKHFPRPVKLSTRRVAWRLPEINDWISNLPKAGGEADE